MRDALLTAQAGPLICTAASLGLRRRIHRGFEDMGSSGVFTPVLAKHSKNFSIEDSFAIGVERIRREFEPRTLVVTSHPCAAIARLRAVAALTNGAAPATRPEHACTAPRPLMYTSSQLRRSPCPFPHSSRNSALETATRC